MFSRLVWLGLCVAVGPTHLPLGAQGTELPATAASATGAQKRWLAEFDLRRTILSVPAAQWPRAEAGRWAEWQPKELPEQAYAKVYGAAALAYKNDDLLLAIAYCKRLLELAPDYPPALLMAGIAFYRLQFYGEAIECYERLLAHAPGTLDRTRQLGHCYFALGRSLEALEHYQRLLEAHPDDWQAERSRGVVLLRNGDLAGAASDLKKVLMSHPEDPETRYWWARWLYETDAEEGVLEAALAARDAAPNTSRTWYLVAQVAFDLGQEELAQQAQERHHELQAIEVGVRELQQEAWRNPSDLVLLERLARLILLGGDLEEAESAYQRLALAAQRYRDEEVENRANRALEGLRQVR